MDDFTQQIIYTEGGNWREVEVLGDRAIVKVKAETATLLTLNATFKRIPKDTLNDSLADLSNAVKTALKNEILDMGYSLAEIQDKLGNDLGTKTLKDVLLFMATRRKRPRYDEANDAIVIDGADVPCNDLNHLEQVIT